MALRCLLFTADEGTAAPISHVLASLGVEGEHCSAGPAAVDKLAGEAFQIVIIDWDQQPEAGLLLTAARDRKPNERPLTLAIVSDETSVPKALQAGANSILRKPIQIPQITDTLTTARGLLRAKESAPQANPGSPAIPAVNGTEKTLRSGEFLQSSMPVPGGQFVTESDTATPGELPNDQLDPLKELEPVAAAVSQQPSPAPPRGPSDEPRGLEWYLKTRGVTRPGPAPAAAAPAPAPEKPQMIGFDQTPSFSGRTSQPAKGPEEQELQDQKTEAKLLAYIDGQEAEEQKRPRFRLGKGAIAVALVLATGAIAAAPQAPWHPQVKGLWKRGQHTVHAWLNPQLVTNTKVAPESHESFGRAGDEYRLPVVENIPDATTDPSQIQVLPVVDPTAKKPTNSGGSGDPSTVQPDAPSDTGANRAATPGSQENPPAPLGTEAAPTSNPTSTDLTTAQPPVSIPAAPTESQQPRPAPVNVPSSLLLPRPADPAGPKVTELSNTGSVASPGNVPSSLKSQMASMTPEASGNKPIEAALPAIEPVAVPEATQRGLLVEQPAIAYPPSAKSQHGTVIVQVLIGRDGTVQDAKFQQGSLAFARTAIDGVKQWKFKPYLLNGRPVSVRTVLTMTFKPGS